MHGKAVFTCHDTTMYYNNQYKVKWFKDGVQISAIPQKIDMFEEILFIQNITKGDIGNYNCQLLTLDDTIVATSKSKDLTLTTGKFHFKQIIYFLILFLYFFQFHVKF